MNLSRPDRPERLDALAAQYALGTLPARPRARLDRLAQRDATVARALWDWERKLATLADAVPPVVPHERVWESLARRLRLEPAETGWWQRLAFWRGFLAGGAVAVLALAVGLYALRPAAPAESIVAVLAGPDARPVLVASVPRGERVLAVKAVAPVAVPADRALELWMLPGQGPPRSLGLIPASGVGRLALAAPPDIAFRGIDALAVSLEPAGGSPTGLPTGPVLYTGRLERL